MKNKKWIINLSKRIGVVLTIVILFSIIYRFLPLRASMFVSSVCFFIGFFLSIINNKKHENFFLTAMFLLYFLANSREVIHEDPQYTYLSFILWQLGNLCSGMYVLFRVDFKKIKEDLKNGNFCIKLKD